MNLAGHAAEGLNTAFCRVAATLRPPPDSDIRIEVWLPLAGWNGSQWLHALPVLWTDQASNVEGTHPAARRM